MNYKIRIAPSNVQGNIMLPSSKSISNRVLIIKALSGASFSIHNLSDSDDTNLMLKAFETDSDEINIGHAGTSMRFLTAYFAATAQRKTITGSERMKNRPIKELVDGLNQLGAEITYADKEGYPPVVTSGKPLTGNILSINGSISSQYITALLLIAPTLPNGLTINISGKLISSSYVKLTLDLMKYFGVTSQWEGQTIVIKHQKYMGVNLTVEGDWSGVSYWYEIAALAKDAEINIQGLNTRSLQGDSAIAYLFTNLGIVTEFTDDGIRIKKTGYSNSYFEFDFVNNPDLVQTFVVTLCLMGTRFKISGASTLRIKETDRIAALQAEMKKLGYVINEPEPGVLTWYGETCKARKHIAIKTYNDHRMAMAFAPVAMRFKDVTINDAMVVTKSYPHFWDDLKMVGFEFTEAED